MIFQDLTLFFLFFVLFFSVLLFFLCDPVLPVLFFLKVEKIMLCQAIQQISMRVEAFSNFYHIDYESRIRSTK